MKVTESIAHDYSGHGLDGIIHGTTWTRWLFRICT